MQKRRNLFRQAPREEGNRLSGLRNFRSHTNGQDIEILQDVSGRKEEKGEKMKVLKTIVKNNELPLEYTTYEPETYEELRHLCIEISNKEKHIWIFNDWGTNNEYLMTNSLKFYPSGTICVNGDNEFVIAENRSPKQMFEIIKSLMG